MSAALSIRRVCMMPSVSSLHSAILDLWLKLSTIAIVALVFAEALRLSMGQAVGWTYYLAGHEIAFEILVRLIFCSLLGIVLGTCLSAVVAPLLWRFSTKRNDIINWVTRISVLLVVFLDSRYALLALIHSMRRGERFTQS